MAASEPIPVAVVGFGGRFPGEATDPQKLWDMCAAGTDGWSAIPDSRFHHAAFYHPDQARNGATNVKGGFFLKEDLARFDAPFFGMTRTEAASLDPQQRLLLECSYEALENAGLSLDKVAGSDMGVFVGSFCFDWAKVTLRDPDALPLYHATGSGQAMLANRLSYFLNVHGPSFTLDTACSSSLVALHQAVQALRSGDCASALVCGVNCLLDHDSLASMSSMGFLSEAGRSYTYDARAHGYGRGEGVACVVLRRLDDALADPGAAVRAVIRNTGLNQDGRTPGITFPSGAAQADLIRRVYAQAGLDLAETTYVEAHGTGTQAGDPIEARALHETFGQATDRTQPLTVGCLKTNIGHLEGASGVAGLIKTVLMLERETLLPNVDFQTANAKIPLADWRLKVPTTTRSWREAAADAGLSVLRASVNGFGYGGTNAHIIVESAADYLKTHGEAVRLAAQTHLSGRHKHRHSLSSHASTPDGSSDEGAPSSASSVPSSPPAKPVVAIPEVGHLPVDGVPDASADKTIDVPEAPVTEEPVDVPEVPATDKQADVPEAPATDEQVDVPVPAASVAQVSPAQAVATEIQATESETPEPSIVKSDAEVEVSTTADIVSAKPEAPSPDIVVVQPEQPEQSAEPVETDTTDETAHPAEEAPDKPAVEPAPETETEAAEPTPTESPAEPSTLEVDAAVSAETATLGDVSNPTTVETTETAAEPSKFEVGAAVLGEVSTEPATESAETAVPEPAEVAPAPAAAAAAAAAPSETETAESTPATLEEQSGVGALAVSTEPSTVETAAPEPAEVAPAPATAAAPSETETAESAPATLEKPPEVSAPVSTEPTVVDEPSTFAVDAPVAGELAASTEPTAVEPTESAALAPEQAESVAPVAPAPPQTAEPAPATLEEQPVGVPAVSIESTAVEVEPTLEVNTAVSGELSASEFTVVESTETAVPAVPEQTESVAPATAAPATVAPAPAPAPIAPAAHAPATQRPVTPPGKVFTNAPETPSTPVRSPGAETDATPATPFTPATSTGSEPAEDHSSKQPAHLPVPKLFVLAAADESSGQAQATRLATYLDEREKAAVDGPALLGDLAYTLASRRSALAWKAAVAASSVAGLRSALAEARFQNAGKAPTVGFVFTGQGAQWFAMGRELAATSAAFRASLERSAAMLAGTTMQADWSLFTELLERDAVTTRVNEPAVSQSLCTVLQVALVDMLRAWGVRPAAVVGHSSGEIGAAYAAELLSQEAAVAAAYFRVPLDSEAAASCRGGMMAIACDEAQTRGLLAQLQRGQAVIACYNSPQSFTISGDDEAIDELAEACVTRGIRHKKLLVGFAYHSHKMAAAAASYRALLLANSTVVSAFANPSRGEGENAIEMFSSVTGRRLEPGALTLDYWVENLVSPVRFTEALTALCHETHGGVAGRNKSAVDVLVEVGPHAALAGPIRQILQVQEALSRSKVAVLTVLRRGQDATTTAQTLACALIERGVPLRPQAVNDDGVPATPAGILLTDLPTYAWNHETPYWAEPRESVRYRKRTEPRHDVLGAPVRFGTPLEPRWRQWIRSAETPWVRDHRVQGLVVYPAAGYICMAIEAARQAALRQADASLELAGYELRDVTLGQALIVPEGVEEVEALFSLRPLAESAYDNSTVWHEFLVYSCSDSSHSGTAVDVSRPLDDTWAEHCRGQIAVRWKRTDDSDSTPVTDADAIVRERARHDAKDRAATVAACVQEVDLDALYAHCTSIGLDYGPTFANLTRARAGRASASDPENHIAGTVTLPDVEAAMPAHVQSPIVVHPGTLDACLHGIMAFRDMLRAAIMPVFFAHVYIDAALGRTAAGDDLGVYLGVKRSGFRNLDIHLTAYGPGAVAASPDAAVPLIRMDGLRMTSLGGSIGDSGDSGLPPKTYYQPAWRPDTGFLTTAQIDELCVHLQPPEAESAALRRLDQSAFYMADAALAHIPDEARAGLSAKGRKLYASLARQRDSVLALRAAQVAADPSLAEAEPHADRIATWPKATPEQRSALLAELQQTGAEGRLLAAVSARMHEIVLGTADPLEVTMRNDVLGQYYAHNPRMARQYAQAAVYVGLLAHKNPQMRILEIGTGTGGATLPLLRTLGGGSGSDDDVPRFAQYAATDISTGFFEQLRDKTKPWQHLMHYQRLDIEKDPAAQHFSPGTYDLVVAANVLHATRNIARTVAHARQLLRPGGTLLLIELVRVPQQLVSTAAVANLFGIFDGWWVAEEDHRQDSPLLAEAQWDAVLREQGFSGLDAAVWETPDLATHQGTTMISTAVVQPPAVEALPSPVLVTDDDANRPWLEQLAAELKATIHTLDTLAITPGQPVVFYQTRPETLGPQTIESMESLRRLFIRPPTEPAATVLWLTRGAITGESAPDLTLVKGLLRTLRVELGGRLVHLDLAVAGDPLASLATVSRVFDRTFRPGAHPATTAEGSLDSNDLELELLEHGTAGGTVFVPRYVEVPRAIEYVASRTGRRRVVPAPAVQPGRPLQLQVGQPGLLDSLYFDDADLSADLPADHVEIAVEAAGVNFHDVMVAMGQIETRSLGRECAGTVTRIGSAVTHLRVGDRVAAPADATFATTVRCAAWRAQIVPPTLTSAQAAALPIVFCTAQHALRATSLAAGETVLIHAASGGLGQALIQLCQHRGATIFATVGTPEKKQFLIDQYGLPAHRIFSSRDDSFAEAVLQATNGQGVDVVFNVLAAELLRASWRCVASFGRFVELGKRDLDRHGRLDMAPFARNVTFLAVDLVALLAGRPAYGARLWAEVMDLVRQGVAHPPTPLTTYSYAEAVTALRTMQAGRHLGKLVLVPQATTTTTTITTETVTSGSTTTTTTTTSVRTTPVDGPLARVMSPRVQPIRLRGDASYLLVGGLGGIGRALAARMVHELGARHLIILSRGGITNAAAADTVAALRAAHDGTTHIEVCNCDVGDAEQLAAALAKAAAAGCPPIAGAVHLGLVMEHALFQDMPASAWNHSLWPKLAGTWNLHRQLPPDLDFFVLLSSMVGIIGNPSQAAYGAASAFQDAFARWRRRHGRAAATVDLGMITGIGYVAEHGDVQHTLRSQGFEEMDSAECLALVEAAMGATPLPPDSTDNLADAGHIVTGLGLGRYTGGDPGRAIYQDARFAYARRLAPLAGSHGDSETNGGAAADGEAAVSLREQLRAATTLADVIALLESALRSRLTALLMLADDDLDSAKPLSQYGLDSLIAVELRNWVSSEMEATVPVLEFLGGRTIVSLSHFIAKQSRLVKKELAEA